MEIVYKKGEEYIKMNVKSFLTLNDYNSKRITQSLKLSLTKKFKISLDDYLVDYYGKTIEKCRFCGTNSEYTLSFEFLPYNKGYLIYEINIHYNKFYCRGKNKNCRGKKLNANSIEFVSITMDMTTNEALKYIHSRNKTPFYKENHENTTDYKKSQIRDINFFDNDEEKFNEYKYKLSKSHLIDYYIGKYGDKKGTLIYNEICKKKDNSSLSYFIKKNNGDMEKALYEFNKKNDKTKQTLDNFIIRYGEEGLGKYITYNEKRKTCLSVDNFIRLYGEVEGIVKRNDWLDKIRCSNFFSKESYILFNHIEELLNITGCYGKNEYFLRDNKNDIVYFYDYTNIEYKFIIEYNGKIWHPDKDIYSDYEWDNWEHPFNKTLIANDVFNKNKRKIEVARNNGFDVLVIWDFEKDKEHKIIEFIKKRLK